MDTVLPTGPDTGERLAMSGSAGTTVKLVEPQTAPVEAPIVVEPTAIPSATPWSLGSFEIAAMALFEELHVTLAKFWVLLSLSVPTAVKPCAVPVGIEGLVGPTAMDTRLAGAREAG